MLLLRVLTMGSVGLNVTSLKWTGPDSEGSEALPRIPLQIEYNDKVRREADIELANEEISSLTLSRNGTGTEIPAPFQSMLTWLFDRKLPGSDSRHCRKAEVADDDSCEVLVMMIYSMQILIDWQKDSGVILSRQRSRSHTTNLYSLCNRYWRSRYGSQYAPFAEEDTPNRKVLTNADSGACERNR